MRGIHWVLIVAIVAVTLLVGIQMQQDETIGDSISNIAEKTADGVKDAAEEAGDKLEEAGDKIEDQTD